MSTNDTQALATIPNTEEVALIRRTIAPNLNQDEFALFMSVCGITGLSPINREIYPLKGRDGRLSIITGVDGFRRIAALSGQYAGQIGPFWLGPSGEWRDYWVEDGHPLAAKVGVLAHGDAQPTWGVAHWKDFYKDTPTWRSMGAHMLAVRAETHAFRKRFSRQMGMVQLDEREPENGTTTSSVVEMEHPALQAPKPAEVGTWQHIADHGQDEPVPESPPAMQNRATNRESDDATLTDDPQAKGASRGVQRVSGNVGHVGRVGDAVRANTGDDVELVSGGGLRVAGSAIRQYPDASNLDLQTPVPAPKGNDVTGAVTADPSKNVITPPHEVDADHQFSDAPDRTSGERAGSDEVVDRVGFSGTGDPARLGTESTQLGRSAEHLAAPLAGDSRVGSGTDRLDHEGRSLQRSSTSPTADNSAGTLNSTMPRPRGRPPALDVTLPDDHPLMVQAKALWPLLLAARLGPDKPKRTAVALTAWIAQYTKELADATPPTQESF